GLQPGRVEIGEGASAAVPRQDADRPLFGARAKLQVTEVVDARAAEVPVHLAAGGVVVAEEREPRPRAVDDRPDVLAAAAGEDGVTRRLVRQQHVKLGAGERRRAAAANAAARRDPPAGARGLVIDAPECADAQATRQYGDVAVADAAHLAVGIDHEAVRPTAGVALPLLQQPVVLV